MMLVLLTVVFFCLFFLKPLALLFNSQEDEQDNQTGCSYCTQTEEVCAGEANWQC